MDFLNLLPKIGFGFDNLEAEHGEEQNFLTDTVRLHYSKYIIKIINEIYEERASKELPSVEDVRKTAEYLELIAVRSCMVMDLYRKSILKMIADIKNKDSLLHQNLFLSDIPTNKSKSVATQTEEIIIKVERVEPKIKIEQPKIEKHLSLDERIRQMEKSSRLSFPGIPEIKQFSQSKSLQRERKYVKPEAHIKKEDILEQEMSDMFSAPSNSSRPSPADLFDECGQHENDHQIDAIIKEIDNYQQPEKKIKLEQSLVEAKVNNTTVKAKRSRSEKSQLKHSSWPYIYHLQKTNLRNVLTTVVAESHIKLEKLKKKFNILFGDEDPADDDTCDNLLGCPSSPSIDLDEDNEILLGSCKTFQSEMVVDTLMLYFKAKKITEKEVFKRLAKHLTEGISLNMPFPDELYCVNYINDFMETHLVNLELIDQETLERLNI